MCIQEEDYTYNPFPSVTVGGPPGDYLLSPPVPSNQFLEFKIISVGVSGVNPGVVQVSGVTALKAIDATGVSTYNGENNNTAIRGHVIPVNANSFLPVLGDWEQVSSPNMHIFIRIDGVIAAFVTIKQRVKILKVVPAPFVTVPHDQPESMNVAREERILQAVYGTEGREIEYGRVPVKRGTVRQLTTGTPEENARVKWGPSRRGE